MAADNAGAIAIAISRVAVTGAVAIPSAIAVRRIAVTGPITTVAIGGGVAETRPVTVAVRRIAVAGPITLAVIVSRGDCAADYRCPERRPAPTGAAPTPSLSITSE